MTTAVLDAMNHRRLHVIEVVVEKIVLKRIFLEQPLRNVEDEWSSVVITPVAK